MREAMRWTAMVLTLWLAACADSGDSDLLRSLAFGEGAPPVPRQVAARWEGSAVVVSWEAPPGVTAWLVEISEGEGTPFRIVDRRFEDPPARLTGLYPTLTYHIRVRGLAADGRSGPSSEPVSLIPPYRLP